MSVEFKAIKRRNPLNNKEETQKFYPQICNTEKIDTDRICHDISKTTSLNPIAIKQVLVALECQLPFYIENGCSVDIKGIGTIYPAIKGLPSENEQEVNFKKIEKAYLNFRPAKRLKQAIKHVENKRASLKRLASTRVTMHHWELINIEWHCYTYNKVQTRLSLLFNNHFSNNSATFNFRASPLKPLAIIVPSGANKIISGIPLTPYNFIGISRQFNI